MLVKFGVAVPDDCKLDNNCDATSEVEPEPVKPLTNELAPPFEYISSSEDTLDAGVVLVVPNAFIKYLSKLVAEVIAGAAAAVPYVEPSKLLIEFSDDKSIDIFIHLPFFYYTVT